MRRNWLVALIVVLVAVVALGGWLFTRGSDSGATKSPQAEPTASAVPSTTAAPTSACANGARNPFEPRTIKVAGVAGAVQVIAPPRDSAGVPGVPPLTTFGKHVFAYDRKQGIRPGDGKGNVLLNAHTWPDGSALGNQLLSGLNRGDRIVVRGEGVMLCYRVTQRIEVPAAKGLAKYYANDGPPQLAIVVCSGRRLGPGQWEDRTIWFASPSV